MKHWWVNQNQTYQHEVGGGFLWSPKTNSNGGRNRFYDAMTETAVGDVIFSFCDTLIKAVGVVTGPHQSAPKPTEFGTTGEYWSHEGWFVPVQFTELTAPIRPKDWMSQIGPVLPEKYSPLQANGNGNQGVYLAPVPDNMANVLRGLLGKQVEGIVAASVVDDDPQADQEQQRILDNKSISITERVQLVKARVGQGLFRSRVGDMEPMCRLTGIRDRRFLRASHIKAWAFSTNVEKLDGANGLMLSPHVDHLFDKGFISFNDDGSLLMGKNLPATLMSAWSLTQAIPIRALTPEQAAFMAYHRDNHFLG
jgi:putative restriction endonuclease